MADTKTQITAPNFTSRVYPTAEDMKLWDGLSSAEKFAAIERDEEAGFQSGIAPRESLKDRLTRVRRS